MTGDCRRLRPGDHETPAVPTFEQALAKLPDGYSEGNYAGLPWGATIKRSEDGRRVWLYGEELGGADIVSFNLYLLSGGRPLLKPCEMSSTKVIDFVLGFPAPGNEQIMPAK